MQHNVLSWRGRQYELTKIYSTQGPDVILLNSNGIKDSDSLKIYGYIVHRKNQTDSPHYGTAIAIKHNISYKLLDDFISDTLAVEIDTTTGKIIIFTLYQPPARQYIPTPDFITLFRRNIPVYMIADLMLTTPHLDIEQLTPKADKYTERSQTEQIYT